METKLSQITTNANFEKPACNIIGLSCVHRFADRISLVVLDKSLGVAHGQTQVTYPKQKIANIANRKQKLDRFVNQ